ncbi:hypothetical protein [Myxacorys almedinensis]|uniref:Uncharacterized protein n=1 Tax=Myxacorys almedinensis A TaxID=2690445 RepID=A0A8J8CKV8_9CYAN|nr:hypothetical protein [Myxacorys almedinensis]NDJ19909.1 hypothetical protein [Myxacorys almedinensis A]
MALNERQIKILQVVSNGTISGEGIANALGSSMQMLRYYLDTMAEDEYLKVAKVYDNSTREFQIVRAYLTDKGRAILEQLKSSEKLADLLPKVSLQEPSVEHADGSSKPATSGRAATQQILLQDVEQIINSLDALQRIVEELPEDRRDIVSVYLSDLQDEIKIVYKRRPQRIKAYFLAVLGTTLPIIKQSDRAGDFIEHARKLSEKLGVVVKLPSLE